MVTVEGSSVLDMFFLPAVPIYCCQCLGSQGLGFSPLRGVYGVGSLLGRIGVSSFSQHGSQFVQRSAFGGWAHPACVEDPVRGCGARLPSACFCIFLCRAAASWLFIRIMLGLIMRVCLASGLVMFVLVDVFDVFGELFLVEPNLKERIIGETKITGFRLSL